MYNVESTFSHFAICLYHNDTDSYFLIQTLGVVGVVGVFVADAQISRGPKVPNFIGNPHFSFFQNKVGCPPYPYKNFDRKSDGYFSEIPKNIFDTQKKNKGEHQTY